MSFEAKTLKNIINSTLFAVSKDDLKPSLTGVLLRFNSNGLTAVSTDGHRLVKYEISDYKNKNFNGDVVVPKKFFSYLLNSLSFNIKISFLTISENLIFPSKKRYTSSSLALIIIVSNNVFFFGI